jgi:hypothetical protein
VKLAQDFSPGTAFRVNDLVPEARLSFALQTNSPVCHFRFHTVSRLGTLKWRIHGRQISIVSYS